MTYKEPSEKNKSIKSSRRSSLLTKQLVPSIEACFADHAELSGIFVSRVCMSKEDGCVTIYISHRLDAPIEREQLDTIKAYKPSIRKMISRILCGSWTPHVAVRLDKKLDNVRKTDDLMRELMEKESEITYKSLDETIRDLQSKLEK